MQRGAAMKVNVHWRPIWLPTLQGNAGQFRLQPSPRLGRAARTRDLAVPRRHNLSGRAAHARLYTLDVEVSDLRSEPISNPSWTSALMHQIACSPVVARIISLINGSESENMALAIR